MPSFLNIVVEWEGAVVEVRPRYWAAHRAAAEAIGERGPNEEEFWRLVKIGAEPGAFVPHAKPDRAREYARLRDELRDSSELMEKDELLEGALPGLPVLKNMGACHLVTLSGNIDGINAALNRLDVWMHFDRKRALPQDRDRRAQLLGEVAGGMGRALVVAGTVSLALTAARAGLPTVALKSGLAFPRQFRQTGIELFFENLDELSDALIENRGIFSPIGLF